MKTRTILIIALTLIIGFIIGFFTSGRIARQRMKHFRDMMDKPKQEEMHLMKRLELTTEQEKEIRPILDTMLPAQAQLRKQHKTQMDSARTVMFNQLKPLLNDAQIKKVERIQRMAPMMPDRKRRKHSN